MPIVTKAALESWLRYAVPDDLTALETVVTGWLLEATGWPALPDPLPPTLQAWALELAGIAHENPTGLQQDTSGATSATWESKDRVLARVQAWAEGRTSTGDLVPAVPAPRGVFPPAPTWPA